MYGFRFTSTGAARIVAVFTLLVAAGAARPAQAVAGWPLIGGDSGVLLGFGATYASAEGSAQHRGVDLQAAAASRVVAPFAGRVTFAGRIPGVGGGRVLAVTIETAHGKITLLPLETAAVAAGTDIADGGLIGSLAESGDGSNPGTHLHVGVRQGDLYVDPLGIMAAPAAAPKEVAGQPVAVSSGVTVGSGVAVGAGAVVAGGETGNHVTVTGGMPAGVSLAPRATARPQARVRTPVASSRPARASDGSPDAATGGVRVAAAAVADTPATLVLGPGGVYMPAAGTTNATATSRGAMAAAFGWLMERARAAAARVVRLAALVLLGVLAGLGTLWPLWRTAERKGPVQLHVRAIGDDVAAVPSR